MAITEEKKEHHIGYKKYFNFKTTQGKFNVSA